MKEGDDDNYKLATVATLTDDLKEEDGNANEKKD